MMLGRIIEIRFRVLTRKNSNSRNTMSYCRKMAGLGLEDLGSTLNFRLAPVSPAITLLHKAGGLFD